MTIEATEGFEALAARVDAALEAVLALDATPRAAAIELKDAIEAAHKDALVTIVRRMREDPAGRELLYELVDDPGVLAVLGLHGIVKLPTAAPAEPTDPAPGTAFIPLSAVGRRDRPSTAAGWIPGPREDAIPAGGMQRVDAGDDSFLITNVGQLAAFRNACGHQGMPLDGGTLDGHELRCPWHGFTYDASTGECLSAPGVQLEPVPLRVDTGPDGHRVVWLRAH